MDGCISARASCSRSPEWRLPDPTHPQPRISIPGSPVSAPGAPTLSDGQQADVGAAVAGARHAGPRRATGPAAGSTPRPGSAGRRRSCWRSAAAAAPPRWPWRRPNRTSTWSPSRSTGAGWRSCSAASSAKASPTSGWSAATASTCSSTCSAPDSLTGVRVFFPDPWPKARHHKRRLLQPDTVALIADRLRPGGVLHAATDHRRLRRTDRRGRRRRTAAAPRRRRHRQDCPSR